MPRSSVTDTLTAVRGALTASPQSINEIADKAKVDWTSTQRWLGILKSLGHVSELTKDGKKQFIKREFSPTDDTLFGIKIEESKKKLILLIYSMIAKQWKNIRTDPLGNTFAEKILADIDKEKKLNLPIGWYIYGLVCVQPFSSSFDYSKFYENSNKDLGLSVEKFTKKYSDVKSTKQLKLQHYRERGNELYLMKEEVLTLKYQKLTKSELEKLSKLLLKMIPFLPNQNKEITRLFTEFMALLIEIEKQKSNDEIQDLQDIIFQSFDEIWKLVAMESFIESLSKTNNYTYEQLQANIEPMMDAQKFLTIEQLRILRESTPSKINTESLSEDEKKLWELKGSGKMLSEDEKKAMSEKWENEEERSKVLGKLGFD